MLIFGRGCNGASACRSSIRSAFPPYTERRGDKGIGEGGGCANAAGTAGVLFQGVQELAAGLLADPAVLIVLGMSIALVAAAGAGGNAAL